MSDPLRLLVIEDEQADFLLLSRYLRTQDFPAHCIRVATTLELEQALAAGGWDAVLVDYFLPGMDFLATLELIRARHPELPVILVSGAIGEERAVELLRLGVADFVLKDRLSRLIPAIERSLREVAESRGRQAAEAALRQGEERLRLALEGGDLAMWDWDVAADALVVNARWAEMLGCPPQVAPRDRPGWEERVHPEDLPVLRGAFDALIEDRGPVLHVEHRLRHQDGRWVWVASRGKVIGRDPDGRPLRVCGTHQDVSERKRLEQELRRLAVTDPLTGVYNRRHLMQVLEAETRRAHRHGRPLALIMLDLDGFKTINDTLGHGQGDAVLVAASKRLGQRLRRSDTLARWGGEEFLILLPETGLAAAAEVAEMLRLGLHEIPCPRAEPVTASFGVAAYRLGETLDQWLKRVDDQVFEAKHGGRDRVAWVAE
jgi:diguanylate cyclase (GGDEF)-like protein/PAS domain S-box-containing protein